MSGILISGILLTNKIKNSTIVYGQKDTNYEINENNEVVEVAQVEENITSTDVLEKNQSEQNEVKELKLCLLGEIMMGGEVSTNLSYSYAMAVKNVYLSTQKADFTYANLATNITNLDNIENPKTEYIVTKNIVNALNALGIDSISIATDHITDFPSDIIKNTISVLENNNIFVAGRENMPVYFQKGNKRIAIISTNSVINGTESLYKKEGISVYNKENLIKNIKEAKENSDFVIVDMHWGREFTYGVTSQMDEIAKTSIDNGANLIIGSHALGIYPIVEYKGVPIIYSLGNFISNSDLYLGKESFIFDITISNENKIGKISMTPIYVKDKKEVLLYNEYDSAKSEEVVEQYNKWNLENGLNSSIINGKIEINF